MDLLNLCRKVKVCKILNCTEHLLILACTVIGCDSISTLASLVGILVGIASSAITINISITTAGIKKFKSIIKKRKTTIILLAETKLITIEVLISKILIDSNSSHDEFVFVNNVLKQYDDMKEEFKKFNDK